MAVRAPAAVAGASVGPAVWMRIFFTRPRIGSRISRLETAVRAHQLAADRDAAQHGEDETAEGVGILLATGRQEAAVDQGLHLFDGVGHPR